MKERRRSPTTPTEVPWEFEPVKEIPTPEPELRVKIPPEEPPKADDEYGSLAHVSTLRDEEDFKEETLAQTRRSEPVSERPSAPTKRKPVRIAGIPIDAKNITQGIIISEILRRPKF